MDTITEPVPTPKKPVKRRKKQARAKVTKAATPAVVREDDELGGLTVTECPFDCNADGCVISGANYCGHPAKGAAQPAMQRDPEAMKRYNMARKKLAHQKAEGRT